MTKPPVPGLPYTGTGDQADESIGGKGVVTAIDPFTGDVRWKYALDAGSASAGVLGTAGGVLFAVRAKVFCWRSIRVPAGCSGNIRRARRFALRRSLIRLTAGSTWRFRTTRR